MASRTEHNGSADGAESTEIVDPLTSDRPTYVQDEQEIMMRQRGAPVNGRAVGKLLDFWSGYVIRLADTRGTPVGRYTTVESQYTIRREKKTVLFSQSALPQR